MPAQLMRFGIDRNSAILSIAWMGYFTLKFRFATEKIFFRTTVLLGGSSVKKLTELYGLNKIVMLWTLPVPIIHQKFFLAYANLVIMMA